MATVYIRVIEVTAEPYWVALDHEDVTIENGVGEADLSPGHHLLQYYAEGSEGQGLTIVIEGAKLPAAISDRIPPGYRHCGGRRDFWV